VIPLTDATRADMQAQSVTFELFQGSEDLGHVTLPILPEEISRRWPAKSTPRQTPEGVHLDTFGLGLPEWTIRGHTGWRKRLVDGRETDGKQAWMALDGLFEAYFRVSRDVAMQGSGPMPEMRLHLFEDHAHWQVEPDGLPLVQRHKQRPLLYQYTVRLTGLRDLTKPMAGGMDLAERLKDAGLERPGLIRASMTTSLDAITAGRLEQAALTHVDQATLDGWVQAGMKIRDSIDAAAGTVTSEIATVRSWVQTGRDLADTMVGYTRPLFQTIHDVHQLVCAGYTLASYPHLFGVRLSGVMADLRGLFVNAGCSSTIPGQRDPF